MESLYLFIPEWGPAIDLLRWREEVMWKWSYLPDEWHHGADINRTELWGFFEPDCQYQESWQKADMFWSFGLLSCILVMQRIILWIMGHGLDHFSDQLV